MSTTKYPVYVISKGRASTCLTARFLIKDRTPFKLVVEPQEYDLYAAHYGEDALLVTPFSDLGEGSIPVRNFVWKTSKELGHERHWIIDDNIRSIRRKYYGRRIKCNSGLALSACERFIDRYTNIAIAGLNYNFFAGCTMDGNWNQPPFYRNVHVYSCLCIRNDLKQRWRGKYNEDTDLCLQVLADKWCTILFNAFLIEKMRTLNMTGGNMDELYKGDGRLKMARSLERQWPGVVDVRRRYGRPQHVVHDQWRKFSTKLILKTGVDLSKLPANEHGFRLRELKPIRSTALQSVKRKWDAQQS